MRLNLLIGVAILSVFCSNFASAQNSNMPIDSISALNIMVPIDPSDPIKSIEVIELIDDIQSDVSLSHICLNIKQNDNVAYIKLFEPSEVTFGCSNYFYNKGYGSPLTLKYVNLTFALTERISGKILYNFSHPVLSSTQEMVYPLKTSTISLPAGEYTLFFKGGQEMEFILDAKRDTWPAQNAGMAGVAQEFNVMPPPTCHATVTLLANYLPKAIDPLLGLVDTIPIHDVHFPIIKLSLADTISNAIYNFKNLTGLNSHAITDANLTVNHYDDFGRLRQVVQREFTTEKDMATLNEYDFRDNIVRSWLPTVITTNDGKPLVDSLFKEACRLTYDNEQASYSLFEYESSPLSRPLLQIGPGDDWHTQKKGIKTSYLTNVVGIDTLNCWRIKPTGESSFIVDRFPTGSLQVTRIENEDGAVVFEFKDFNDCIVLSRQVGSSIVKSKFIDTYYVYDHFGRLVAVFPPKLSDSIVQGSFTGSEIHSLAYLYSYGVGDYLTAKKIPGAEWTYFLYDCHGRIVFSQDGNQRSRNEWGFNLVDGSGRVAITGVCKNEFNHSKQPLLNFRIDCTYVGSTETLMGYAVNGIRLNSAIVYAANYYDHYHFIDANIFPVIYGWRANPFRFEKSQGFDNPHPNSRGLSTGNIVARIDSTGVAGYDYKVAYYDHRDRVIQQRSTNLRAELEVENIACNFSGQPTMRRIEQFVRRSIGSIMFQNPIQLFSYTYDDWGRLLTAIHQCDNNPKVTLVDNQYDDLGRLIANKRNGNLNLRTDYDYNIRSWTKSISGPLFSQELYYQESYANGGNTPSFSGNISASQWTLAGDRVASRGYAYTYDKLSRLTAANYFENNASSNNYSSSYAYDKNSNITQIFRMGRDGVAHFGVIDNLLMTYNGNHLKNLYPIATALNSPHLGNLSPTPMPLPDPDLDIALGGSPYFAYDQNGNMTKDISRGINEIRYNLLNLPMKMRISNSRGDASQWYVYGADGRKLRAFIDMGLNDLQRDYVGNRIYENGSLKRILVDGGYIQDGIYCFFIVDHLGNTRVVAKANGDILQSNHYYPYGQSFAEGSEDSDQPYKYNGKELDSNLGLNFYDYGARSMDVIYNRFTTIDPLSEKYPHISPYAYCIGNPIKYVDPDGMDWALYSLDGKADATWNWVDGKEYRTGVNDLNGKEVVLPTYEAVAVFDGSYDERLGVGDNMYGEGAVLANVTVYGPSGADDIDTYQGFTLTSDYKKFGAIADGEYDVSHVALQSHHKLPKTHLVNGGNPVDCVNGVNRSPAGYKPYSKTKKNGIFIHRANNNGWAGDNAAIKNAVSSGCLLVAPRQWDAYNKQIGNTNYRLILKRK